MPSLTRQLDSRSLAGYAEFSLTSAKLCSVDVSGWLGFGDLFVFYYPCFAVP